MDDTFPIDDDTLGGVSFEEMVDQAHTATEESLENGNAPLRFDPDDMPPEDTLLFMRDED